MYSVQDNPMNMRWLSKRSGKVFADTPKASDVPKFDAIRDLENGLQEFL